MKDTLSINRQAAQFARASLPGTKPVSVFALCALCAGAMLAGASVQAATITWDGGTGGTGTSWNDAANWGGDILPTSADTVFFTSAGLPASTVISLGASQSIREFRINSYSAANSFTIGSAADITAGYTLTLTNVYRGDNVGNTQNIAAAIKLAANSTWTIINGYNGTLNASGSIGSDSDVSFTKEGSNTLTLSGANTFTGSLRAYAGGLVLSGSNAYTGNTEVSGGSLSLNFGATTATNIVNSGSTLVMGGVRGGGTLTVTGRNLANVINSQTFDGLTLDNGASSLAIVNGIASGKTLVSLGAITRNAGSSVNFSQPTVNTAIGAENGFATTTANDAGGILGGWATVGAANWATNNGTNIVAYTAYTDDAWAAGNNTNVTTSGTITDDSTTHSLRFNAAAANTLTLGGINTITSGGILVTSTVGNNLTTITGGTLRGSSGGDLVIHQHNSTNALTIASAIADNTVATALTKSGGGVLNLTGTLSYTGGTYVNAGTLNLLAGSTDQLVTTGAITVSGGTLNFGTGTNQTTSGAVVLAGGTISGGTLTKSGTNYDVRNGTISTRLAGSAGIDKTTGGTLTLSNTSANTFTGTTTITEGSVVGGSAANVIAINGDLVVGSVSGGNSASYSNSGNNTAFNSARNVTVYSNGSVNFGGGAQGLNGTVSILGGSITGSQIYQNVTVSMTGGSWGGTTYGNVNSFTSNASADTAVVSAALQSGQATKTFTVADGTAAVDMLMSGGIASGAVTKAGAGYLSMTGSKAYSGITTVSGGTLAAAVLANGGSASSIGSSSNAAASLRLGNGTTFEYTGSGHSTDRLFTVNGTAAADSATLNASGTGAVSFTNTGSIAWGSNNQTRTLKLGGTSTANNTLSALIANNGSGAVAITKEGVGKWILANANTYGGATTVSAGTLALGANNAIGASSAISLDAGTLDLQTFSTTAASLSFNGGSTLKFNLGTPGNVTALLALSGNLDPGLGLGAYTLDFSGSGAEGTYNLISYAGTFFGDVSEFTVMNLGAGLTGELFLGSNLLSLTVTAVPEPSTYAVIVGLLALATVTCRRSRRRA